MGVPWHSPPFNLSPSRNGDLPAATLKWCWQLRQRQLPVWLCHIRLQVGSGTATAPFCGMMHVFLIHHLDFEKHHKAPKSGLKRPFSHRFALA